MDDNLIQDVVQNLYFLKESNSEGYYCDEGFELIKNLLELLFDKYISKPED